MNRLRHIAIATRNPAEAAKFFVEVMGMTVTDKGEGPNPNYFLTDDGSIELALVNLTPHGVMGVERPEDYEGLHHIGFEVDDLDGMKKRMADTPYKPRDDIHQAIKARNEAREKATGVPRKQRKGGVEYKYWGPAGITFDLMQKEKD